MAYMKLTCKLKTNKQKSYGQKFDMDKSTPN